MVDNPSRKHHYIPKFYLNGWTNKDGKLEVFALRHNRLVDKRQHPDATGYKKDLYSMPALKESLRDRIETRFLKMVDDHANNVIERLRRLEAIDTSKVRSSWARLLLSLMYRNPDKIEYLKEAWDRTRTGIAQEAINAGHVTAEMLETPEYRARFEQGFVDLFEKLIDHKQTGKHLIQMRWRTVRLANGFPLLTSDLPLVCTNGMIYPEANLALALLWQKVVSKLSTAVRTSRMRWWCEQGEDGLPDGGQAWPRRWAGGSFSPARLREAA